MGQMSSDAKKWTSDGITRPQSCPTTNCPTCPTCNYAPYTSQIDTLKNDKATLETQKADLETRLDTAEKSLYTYAIGAGLIALILGLILGYKTAPKDGNRPRPPMPTQPQPTLKPHKHKGGVPPQSAHVKKKELIGRE